MDHRIIAAGAALSIVAVVLAWIYRQGGDDVRQSIRQNNEAGRTADDVRSRFDLCPPGMWEVGAGKCRRSALGSGN
ncbi:hypothetical protein CN221_21575 [Sinorhizobium meliloti]|uniref:Uncharacterized protein n=1 Tax=Rhizobium meliloti TaxID=382 RepID=A0AAW9TKT5_RHIML|nr:hypothetical protein [Sinorhizobium meliloti]RVG91780.1 hypothetical protein CN221_21575 [Sinorhizobium meliloti]RVH55596.1 hypothetical protein CN209_33485 [Sinorhizobium meliloti]RVH65716.1 hypothetical protein CN203_36715 [Sinorhizobium meliloti]RVJ44336.1 hypothetical protein CN175_30845 [Sinorhizobium meliloti]